MHLSVAENFHTVWIVHFELLLYRYLDLVDLHLYCLYYRPPASLSQYLTGLDSFPRHFHASHKITLVSRHLAIICFKRNIDIFVPLLTW